MGRSMVISLRGSTVGKSSGVIYWWAFNKRRRKEAPVLVDNEKKKEIKNRER